MRTVILAIVLGCCWLIWSGHFDNRFLLALGIASCLFSVWISLRMQIVDDEGAPLRIGYRTLIFFAPWLAWEIVRSNIAVAKIIVSPQMNLKRNLVEVPLGPHSTLGKVVLANSITLTPGTVSVRMEAGKVLVHALSFEGAAEDLSGSMDERVRRLES